MSNYNVILEDGSSCYDFVITEDGEKDLDKWIDQHGEAIKFFPFDEDLGPKHYINQDINEEIFSLYQLLLSLVEPCEPDNLLKVSVRMVRSYKEDGLLRGELI